jgi:type II secretory pathway pseudopilin PulG
MTLVELIITIALAAILGIPAGILLSEHLGAALRARDFSVAMSLARAEMERLDSLVNGADSDTANFCTTDLALGAVGPTAIAGYPQYSLTRTVSCQTPSSSCACSCSGSCGTGSPTNARNDIKRIEIRVTSSGSGESLASLATYRTKYVLFGS